MEKPMDKKRLTTAGGIRWVLSTLGVAKAAFASEEISSIASKAASSARICGLRGKRRGFGGAALCG
jgi:hypothetical protein